MTHNIEHQLCVFFPAIVVDRCHAGFQNILGHFSGSWVKSSHVSVACACAEPNGGNGYGTPGKHIAAPIVSITVEMNFMHTSILQLCPFWFATWHSVFFLWHASTMKIYSQFDPKDHMRTMLIQKSKSSQQCPSITFVDTCNQSTYTQANETK